MAKFEGFYLAGTLQGFKSTPWSSDPTKFNHRVGIARTYEDDWGNAQTDVTEVDVSLDDVQVIQKQCDILKGQDVIVRVVPSARKGGKTGAWLSVFIPKGEKILPQSKPETARQAG
ncbi:hypothetical protein [Amphritea japonica]|nr:hypothetical protein [Amphritea japonica]